MVEEGDASQIVHMTSKLKRKQLKKNSGKTGQNLIVVALVFVGVFILGFWYLLSMGEAEVKGSKSTVIIENKKGR